MIELDTVKCDTDSYFRESAAAGANQAPPAAGCLHHQPRSLKHEVSINFVAVQVSSTY